MRLARGPFSWLSSITWDSSSSSSYMKESHKNTNPLARMSSSCALGVGLEMKARAYIRLDLLSGLLGTDSAHPVCT